MKWVGRVLRAIPWYVWVAMAAVGAWFGRNIMLVVATVIAFHPIPIPPLLQNEPGSVQEAQAQDLRHFEHVRRNERSMDDATRARFDTQVAHLNARAGEMSAAEFTLGLARAQAIIDNGHSNGSATAMVRPFPHLPIRTAFFGDELRVMRATGTAEALIGLRVTHINGVNVEDATARFRDAFGGNDANFRILVPLLLETPALLEAVGLGAGRTLTLLGDDGQSFEQTLAPIGWGDVTSLVTPGDLPLSWRRDGDDWRSVTPAGDPLYLRRPERGYWRENLPSIDGMYINIRTNMDDRSGQTLRTFARETVTELRARPRAPRVLIVDLRFNHGGDYTLTHELMSALGDIVGPQGRIYLLASGNTFSAAIVSMAFAKQSAPDRTIVVGEEIGDRLQFWAEGWHYALPNSRFRARYATAYYDLQHGCTGIFRCYWGAFYLFPVLVDDLDVDIRAPLTFDAYLAGHDPGLDAILARESANGAER